MNWGSHCGKDRYIHENDICTENAVRPWYQYEVIILKFTDPNIIIH